MTIGSQRTLYLPTLRIRLRPRPPRTALQTRDGFYSKQRAVLAVARKLVGVLYQLWKTGEAYDPFFAPRRRELP